MSNRHFPPINYDRHPSCIPRCVDCVTHGRIAWNSSVYLWFSRVIAFCAVAAERFRPGGGGGGGALPTFGFTLSMQCPWLMGIEHEPIKATHSR